MNSRHTYRRLFFVACVSLGLTFLFFVTHQPSQPYAPDLPQLVSPSGCECSAHAWNETSCPWNTPWLTAKLSSYRYFFYSLGLEGSHVDVSHVQQQQQQLRRQQERHAQSIHSTAAIPSQPTTIIDPAEYPCVLLFWFNTYVPFYWDIAPGVTVDLPNYFGHKFTKVDCPSKCLFTTDTSLLHVADALVFDPTWHGTDEEWKRKPPLMPEKRHGQQIGRASCRERV
eukprot:TRINITY_DN1473_c0_g1_i3.p1 TRINITY_DN1473_c0_g1~~TRINITY_DN1473_c0_g1_i3.p1  ORF type:complete len:226 (+),score=28.79 TRINITY_DN1473_c0_g1_i3:281-958(+)